MPPKKRARKTSLAEIGPVSNKTVLAIGAHPDDVEFLCSGTLFQLKKQGWSINVATMTPGDVGAAFAVVGRRACVEPCTEVEGKKRPKAGTFD